MAEGWAKWYGRSLFEIHSAGIETHGKNPRAIAVMKEAGVDISDQESTKVSDDMLAQADLVVTVCGHADEHCPVLPAGTRQIHWPPDDPAKAEGTEAEIMKVFMASRDDIYRRVYERLNELKEQKADFIMASCYNAVNNEVAQDPNLVKVIMDADHNAIYFSRNPIPFNRSGSATYFGHIGIYGFTKRVCMIFVS